MLTYMMSALTAHGDTVKTLIDTVTMPNDIKRIVGVGCYADAAAALTTAEPVTGMLELESDDFGEIVPCQVPVQQRNPLVTTSGALVAHGKVDIYPVDISGPKLPKARIKGSVTLDLAQTGAQKARFILAIER